MGVYIIAPKKFSWGFVHREVVLCEDDTFLVENTIILDERKTSVRTS